LQAGLAFAGTLAADYGSSLIVGTGSVLSHSAAALMRV
jgi:hypothetical protein